MTKIKTVPTNKLTVVEHLDELRNRLIKAIVVLLVTTSGALFLSKHIVAILKWPSRHFIDLFILIKPTEIISVYFKSALYVGLILSAPFILYQAWCYIKPAVTQPIKFGAALWIIAAVSFFGLGTAFAFFIISPQALKFLFYLSQESATPMLTLNFYVSFMLAVLVLGGCIFEIPIVAGLLTRLGLITANSLQKKRKAAIMIMFIIAAILTPTTDFLNLMLFALPMMLLYEVGIGLAKLIEHAS